jgi:hypothetical protein
VGGTIVAQLGSNGARTLTAQLDNQGVITLGRAMTLNGASATHTNSGTIDVSGGIFTVTQSGTTPSFTNTGTIAISATRTLTITGGVFTNADTPTAGEIRGGGTLNVSGTTFTNDGNVSPGTVGATAILSHTGDYPQGASGALNIRLGGITAGSEYDRLAVSGTATLGGTRSSS